MDSEQKLSLLSKISSELVDLHEISYYEYELFNKIKRDEYASNEEDSNSSYTSNNKENTKNYKIGEENNANEKKIEDKLMKEKIKTTIEKIYSYIKDKKEYEFISDYFITESEPNSSQNYFKQNSDLQKNNINNDFNINSDIITEDYLKSLSHSRFDDIKSIMDFNNKIQNNNSISHSNSQQLKKNNSGVKVEDIFLPEINKAKSHSSGNLAEENIKSKEEMDNELEEELNRQIFGYTKRMKQSALNFGEQLRKDNKTLNDIENIQNIDQDKTKTQLKRLIDFNYNIKIGFCQLFFMIITVISSFIFCLLIMKIFPKLA